LRVSQKTAAAHEIRFVASASRSIVEAEMVRLDGEKMFLPFDRFHGSGRSRKLSPVR
jgi:hypothetical protein